MLDFHCKRTFLALRWRCIIYFQSFSLEQIKSIFLLYFSIHFVCRGFWFFHPTRSIKWTTPTAPNSWLWCLLFFVTILCSNKKKKISQYFLLQKKEQDYQRFFFFLNPKSTYIDVPYPLTGNQKKEIEWNAKIKILIEITR